MHELFKMHREFIRGWMEENIKAHGKIIAWMVRGNTHGKMEEYMRVNT